MAFDDVRLPTNIEFGAVGGPAFRTEVAVTGGGFEQRNAEWTLARGQWDVAPGVQGPADLDAIIAFFYARRGKSRGFRFKDHTDFSATAQVLIAASGSPSETSVQAVKTYTSGPVTYSRTITKLVGGTVQLYINGSPIGSSPDLDTGVIAFSGLQPGDTLTGDFDFDVPVRFDIDSLPIRQVSHGHERIGSIPILEIRDIA